VLNPHRPPRPPSPHPRYAQRKRIVRLAISPAYTNVWICPRLNGHLRSTGLDARGRQQHRYHPGDHCDATTTWPAQWDWKT